MYRKQGYLSMVIKENSTSVTNELEGLIMDTVTIFGLGKEPKSISVGKVDYNITTKVGTLYNLNQLMTNDWKIELSF